MKHLAIIPARSGSKGLPDKNIRPLRGKPLLAYSVEAALGAELFDTVHVSTDSEDYARIARDYGADVHFLRSAQTASDTASSWDTVRETLLRYRQEGAEFDAVTLLQPTSPLRTSEDIRAAHRLFQDHSADAVVSVTEVEHPVEWCFRLPEDRSMEQFAQSACRNLRRQEIAPSYRENGAIYIVRCGKLWEPDGDIYQGHCYAYVMENARSVDIDTLTDFAIAECLMGLNKT